MELDSFIGRELDIGEFVYRITKAWRTGGGIYFDCDRWSKTSGKVGKVTALHESTFFNITYKGEKRFMEPLFRERGSDE